MKWVRVLAGAVVEFRERDTHPYGPGNEAVDHPTKGKWLPVVVEVGQPPDSSIRGSSLSSAGYDGRIHDPTGPVYVVGPESVAERYSFAFKPLAALKALRLADLAALRTAKEVGGFAFGGALVASDRESSQPKILAAHVAAAGDPNFSADWKIAPGVYLAINATQATQMWNGLRAHVAACYAQERSHATAILALTDAAAIVAYDISTGWPA